MNVSQETRQEVQIYVLDIVLPAAFRVVALLLTLAFGRNVESTDDT